MRAVLLAGCLACALSAQTGRVNYFSGRDSRYWVRDSPATPAAGNAGLDYATFLGGSGDQHAAAVATDAAGNIYVAGTTSSKDFPVTSGALQSAIAPASLSGQTAFVAKFSVQGVLVYCTYLGGNGDDQAFAIATDAQGNAYVAGETNSANFPTGSAQILGRTPSGRPRPRGSPWTRFCC